MVYRILGGPTSWVGTTKEGKVTESQGQELCFEEQQETL